MQKEPNQAGERPESREGGEGPDLQGPERGEDGDRPRSIPGIAALREKLMRAAWTEAGRRRGRGEGRYRRQGDDRASAVPGLGAQAATALGLNPILGPRSPILSAPSLLPRPRAPHTHPAPAEAQLRARVPPPLLWPRPPRPPGAPPRAGRPGLLLLIFAVKLKILASIGVFVCH